MLWAIVSSVFVMYLYRTLNITAGAETAGGAVLVNGIDAELAKLNSRIDAIESLANGKARGTTP
jgi:3-methyladenine DNA glycosylase Mpg